MSSPTHTLSQATQVVSEVIQAREKINEVARARKKYVKKKAVEMYLQTLDYISVNKDKFMTPEVITQGFIEIELARDDESEYRSEIRNIFQKKYGKMGIAGLCLANSCTIPCTNRYRLLLYLPNREVHTSDSDAEDSKASDAEDK